MDCRREGDTGHHPTTAYSRTDRPASASVSTLYISGRSCTVELPAFSRVTARPALRNPLRPWFVVRGGARQRSPSSLPIHHSTPGGGLHRLWHHRCCFLHICGSKSGRFWLVPRCSLGCWAAASWSGIMRYLPGPGPPAWPDLPHWLVGPAVGHWPVVVGYHGRAYVRTESLPIFGPPSLPRQ